MDVEKLEVTHNEAESRFEVWIEGCLSKLDYIRDGKNFVIAHVGVDPEFRGQGVAGKIAQASLEYAKQNVRVNAVAPGPIDTRMFRDFATTPEVRQILESANPMGRIGQPEEIASTVVWLCSDRASFVSGESMLVDAAAVAR